MPEIKLFELQDIENAFGPILIPLIPTLTAATVLFLISCLLPKGILRQVFGIISMVFLVAIYIYSTADTAINW